MKKPGASEKVEITPVISPATRSGTLRSERMPSRSSTSVQGDHGPARRSSLSTGLPRAAAWPMRPSPTGISSVRQASVLTPWAATCTIAVRSALNSPMPHPVLAMRPVTDRLIVSSSDPRSSRALTSWLVRFSAASSSARSVISAWSRARSTAAASGRATSVRISASPSVKA